MNLCSTKSHFCRRVREFDKEMDVMYTLIKGMKYVKVSDQVMTAQ